MTSDALGETSPPAIDLAGNGARERGSGVAEEMAARDWSGSPLGPPEEWPAELRSMLRVLEASRFSMWLGWGPELLFFYNDAYRRDTLGIKHPWALGRPAREVWAEIWDELAPRIAQVVDRGQATWDEALPLILERRGFPEETYHTFSYSPVTADDGAVLGMLCVVSEDTDRVIGERRMACLRELASDLSEHHEEDEVVTAVGRRLAADLRDLPFTCIYLEDDSGRMRLRCTSGIKAGDPAAPLINEERREPAWPLDSGRSGASFVVTDLGQRFSSLPCGAWSRPPSEAVVLPLLQRGRSAPMGHLVAALNPLRPRDAEYVGWVELLAGQVAASLASARAFEGERQRAEALAEIDRVKTTFFSNVSHEFRTPLTLMLGPLDNAIEHEPETSVRDELVVARRNGGRLLRLVNSLLDFSRIEAGRMDAAFQATDLGRLTQEIASAFRSAFEAAGLQLRVQADSGDLPVYVDPEMWEKILSNLLSNALKHTFEGGAEVILRCEDGRAHLKVHDTGTGIPADELPRLFERFHRVEGARARTHEGTGIGLALVQELVLLHGGAITAESELGRGTTMTVTVPLGPGHLPQDLIRSEGPREMAGAAVTPFVEEALRWMPGTAQPQELPAPARDGSVLIVDDNPDMRDYLVRLLAPHYRVTTASDAEGALRVIADDLPELVLSDVMMPGIGGLGLVQRLRTDARTAGLPIVLLSARAGEEAAAEGLEVGADDYLVKPFSARELVARVSANLELGRGRREGEQRFRELADRAPALVWLMNHDGARTLVNRAWLGFTGRSLDQELGEGWLGSVHGDDRGAVRKLVRASIARGEAFEVEYRLRRHDGAYRWMLDRGAPVRAEGVVRGWAGGCLDVHERHLERDQQSLLATIGAALDASLTVDERLSDLDRILVERGVADGCAIDVVDPDGPPSGDSAIREARREGRRVVVAPLTARGRSLGSLTLTRMGSGSFDDGDVELIAEIGRRTGLAIDNARLLEEEVEASRRLQLLHEATAELSAATSRADVAEAVIRQASRLARTDSSAVYEIVGDRLVIVLPGDWGDTLDRDWPDVPLSYPSAGTESARERRTVVVESRADCARRYPPEVAAAMEQIGIRSAAAIPLVLGPRCIGIIFTGWADEHAVDERERETLEALAEQCALALDRARLAETHREIASTLQRSLLPRELPRLARLEVAARYAPAAEGTEAGGDWYDAIQVDDDALILVVGDVVGRGPSAAAVMGQLRSALNAYLTEGHGPAAALGRLDRFARGVEGAVASTAVCVRIDAARSEAVWACAGHPAPILVNGSGARRLEQPRGPVLAALPAPIFEERRADMEEGDCLLAFSDGLFERRGETVDVGLDRLASSIADHADQRVAELVERVFELALEGPAADDSVLAAVRMVPGPLGLRRPARPAELAGLRGELRQWLAAVGITGGRADDLVLAAGEAAANCVEHAYFGGQQGDVEVAVALEDHGSVTARVRDFGRWLDPTRAPNRGRGIPLMRSCVDEVRVEHDHAGTVVHLRQDARPAGETARPGRRATPAESTPFGVDVVADGDRIAVKVRGDVDLDTAPDVRAALAAALSEAASVILDLTEARFFGSAGVALVVDARDRARSTDARFVVRALPASASERVLVGSGLDAVLVADQTS